MGLPSRTWSRDAVVDEEMDKESTELAWCAERRDGFQNGVLSLVIVRKETESVRGILV